ncbi:amino acid permease [Sciscionella sediminilitoris]|uniref:amino acid permease n=1 Tax=Sciscionella sediminilitoris TaxID=1445613 RepID=UPI0004DEF9FC|nr:amino acid permease [Sciscionella sp. SE31]
MTTESPGESNGLRRELSARQISMIALGGIIGTGLFLGSGLAIGIGGPSVIIAYIGAGAIALALTYALAEMVSTHPDAGGFGAIAQRYLGPLAGFVQRWIYWAAQVVNLGSEAVATGLYVRFWFPQLPLWVPVLVFSVVMLAINAAAVRFFGETEYWFALIKVLTIVVFVLLGACYVIFGLPDRSAVGFGHLTDDGGFFPNGAGSLWLALTVVTFSYIGTEAVAVTAAESRDPRRTVPRAARSMVLRLIVFYVLATAVVVTVVPWRTAAGAGEAVRQSPFVTVFADAGIPVAAGIMNFVVLTAALSAMNTNLYITSRMAHSLARDGFAPKAFARTTRHGVPLPALGFSAAGLLVACLISFLDAENAFAVLLGLALFGALVTWLLIFASHVAFRRANTERPPVRLWGAPFTTVFPALVLLGVLVTTAFTDQFGTAWKAGVPVLVLLVLAYLVVRRRRATRSGSGG